MLPEQILWSLCSFHNELSPQENVVGLNFKWGKKKKKRLKLAKSFAGVQAYGKKGSISRSGECSFAMPHIWLARCQIIFTSMGLDMSQMRRTLPRKIANKKSLKTTPLTF